MSSLNDIVRRHLMEYMIRHELSFIAFAAKLDVPEDRIVSWISGNHDFSINEISLIELGLRISIITHTENDVNSYGKTFGDLNLLIDQSLSNLSVRSQNIIQKLRQEYIDPFKLLEKVSEAVAGKYNLSKAGKKTLSELKDYNHWLSVNSPAKVIKSDERVDYFKQLCFKHKLSPLVILKYTTRTEANKPSLYFLFNLVFEHSALFKKSLKEVFNIYKDTSNDKREMPLAEAADLLNLTRERIRQLKLKMDEEIVALGNSFKEILEVTKLIDHYSTLFNSSFITIDKNLSTAINISDDVNLSIKTIALLTKGVLYPDGNLLTFKSNSIYLVPSKWTAIFLFHQLDERVKGLSAMNVVERQEISWDRLYSELIVDRNDTEIKDVLKFVDYILNEEYGFVNNAAGKVSGIRPKHMALIEKIYLAISHYNIPVNIDMIIDYINSEYPQTKFTRNSIHAALIRSSLIMTFGKSGTYGLKEWEGKRDNIKSGSIADLVYQHLEAATMPVHIHDIYENVTQFRATTKKSIIGIMSLDPQRRFELYGNSFYGIAGKIYDSTDTVTNPISNKTIQEIRRLLSERGPLSDIKVEQHLMKVYGLTSAQANHFIDETVKCGRLKLIEGSIHLPTWIQGGLKREIKLNAYHIEQNRLAMEQQKEMDKHPASLEEAREMQKRLDRAWREMQRNKGINPGNK